MFKVIVPFFILLTAMMSHTAAASCSLKQEACELACKVEYHNDSFGKLGCVAQCKAKRAACSTKEGVEDATEKAEELLNKS